MVSLLSQLSGTVSVEHGGFTVTTSVDLRREIERGDAIIINGESAWQTMDIFVRGSLFAISVVFRRVAEGLCTNLEQDHAASRVHRLAQCWQCALGLLSAASSSE